MGISERDLSPEESLEEGIISAEGLMGYSLVELAECQSSYRDSRSMLRVIGEDWGLVRAPLRIRAYEEAISRKLAEKVKS